MRITMRALAILAGIALPGTAAAAEMPSECRRKLHLAKGSSEMVQEALKRVSRASEDLTYLGYEVRSWNADTLDTERMGTTMERAGSALLDFTHVNEIHIKNTSAAFRCILRNWPKSVGGRS